MTKMTLLLLIIFAVQPALSKPTYTQDDLEIREHMAQMYNLREKAFQNLADPKMAQENAQIMADLRVHLHSVMPKVPPKIKNLAPEIQQKLFRAYQGYIAKAILVTTKLEDEILREVEEVEDIEVRETKINNWAMQLMKVISRGHREFR